MPSSSSSRKPESCQGRVSSVRRTTLPILPQNFRTRAVWGWRLALDEGLVLGVGGGGSPAASLQSADMSHFICYILFVSDWKHHKCGQACGAGELGGPLDAPQLGPNCEEAGTKDGWVDPLSTCKT